MHPDTSTTAPGSAAWTTTTTNRETVCRYVEEIVNGDGPDVLRELIAPGHITHCPDGDLYGPDGVRLDIAELRGAFPDLAIELLDLVADDERVARRFVLRGTHLGPFMGIEPTGRAVEIPGMAMHRVADGRLTESWIVFDVVPLITPPFVTSE